MGRDGGGAGGGGGGGVRKGWVFVGGKGGEDKVIC